MGNCQNDGPFLGTLNNRCRAIIGSQKGTIFLTTTHMWIQQPAASRISIVEARKLEHQYPHALKVKGIPA